MNDHELDLLRRSAVGVLACAVLELFSGVQLLGGGVSRDRFYCDFRLPEAPTGEILKLIDEKFSLLVAEDRPIACKEMLRDVAASYFRHHHQRERAEQISRGEAGLVSLFAMGLFLDVVEGPFAASTGLLRYYKLQELHLEASKGEGAIRVLGVVGRDKKEIKNIVKQQAEARRLDHRLLGPQLGWIACEESLIPERWFFRPKGYLLLQVLREWWEQAASRLGCRQVVTGLSDQGSFGLGHALMQRAFPQAEGYAEWGIVEPDGRGEAWGLLAHPLPTANTITFFCQDDELEHHLTSLLQFMWEAISLFELSHQAKVFLLSSTKERGDMGKQALTMLRQAADGAGFVWEEEGKLKSLLGPRLEFRLRDCVGRTWQGPLLALHYELPHQLGLEESGRRWMVSCSFWRSVEEWVALLIEHFAGRVPLWLAPEQVRLLPVTEQQRGAVERLFEQLHTVGVRCIVDATRQSVGERVREAQLERVPFTVVIGRAEEEKGSLSVRSLDERHGVIKPMNEWKRELVNMITTSRRVGNLED